MELFHPTFHWFLEGPTLTASCKAQLPGRRLRRLPWLDRLGSGWLQCHGVRGTYRTYLEGWASSSCNPLLSWEPKVPPPQGHPPQEIRLSEPALLRETNGLSESLNKALFIGGAALGGYLRFP